MKVAQATPMLVVERFETLAGLVAVQVLTGGDVIRFGDDGSVVAPDGSGNVAELSVALPHLPGLTELVVERATVTVRGRAVDLAPVTVTHTTAGHTVRLTGPGGALRQVDIRDLHVPEPGDDGRTLQGSSGSPAAWWWHETDDGVVREAGAGGHHLHLLVRPAGQPPVAAAPHYAMPGNPAGLYGPVLAGATLQLDHPAAGTARVRLDPPVAGSVDLFLATNGESGPHTGLPNEASGVAFTSTAIVGTWSSMPRDVTLTAAAGDRTATVATFAGDLPADDLEVDLTPAARSLLAGAYDPGASAGEVVLAVQASSATAGELVAGELRVEARYRHVCVGPEGVGLSLTGAPGTVQVEVPSDLRPARAVLTVDGRFGPAVLVTAADGWAPPPAHGVRLAGDTRAARRVPLAGVERARPLVRVGLLLGADSDAEVLVEVLTDRDGRPGGPLGEAVALVVPAGGAPTWHRAALPSLDPVSAAAVWVVARATTGTARWYGPVADGSTTSLVTVDAGRTWDHAVLQPACQLHVVTEPQPEPLALHGPTGLLAADVLAAPARRSRVEGPPAAIAALTGEPPAGAALAAPSRSASFRKEAVEPFDAAGLAALADLGGVLPLTFSCRRDVELRVLDVELAYNPWNAR